MDVRVRIDGVSVAPEEAQISIFDRGFLYGQAAFETLRTYEGIPFEAETHIRRLQESARRAGIQPPENVQAIVRELTELHAETDRRESVLRVSVTAGQGPISLRPVGLSQARRIVWAYPIPEKPNHWWSQGARAILDRGPRRAEPAAKTHAYLPALLSVHRAEMKEAEEALLVDALDQIHEGASSNIFIVTGGVVWTPPLQAGILPGITRDVVMRALRDDGLPVRERPIRVRQLLAADEVFITSSIREIVPITHVGDQMIGAGQPGPWTETARTAFRRQVELYNAQWRLNREA
ncbi:MAG: aminotransferase class IV [Myxococcota bacterium]